MITRFLRPAALVLLAVVRSAQPSAPQYGPVPAVDGVLLSGKDALAFDPQPRLVIEEVNPWTHLKWNADPRQFQFAIVSDRTGGHRPGVFEDAMGKLGLLQPEFVLSVGDLIEGYSEDPATIQSQWAEFDGFVRPLEMPFFYVPGNHDLSNPAMVEQWQRRFGRLYYHFVYQDVLFLCLDSEDPPPTHISAEQIEYVRQALEGNSGVRWTLVFLHKPLWTYPEDTDTGWQQVEALLKGRQHTVFAGHYHTYTKHERNDSRYFVLATTGGASSLQGPVYGQFDHVVWVTMTEGGPRVANLMLEGIWDEDIRTARVAAIVDAVLMGGVVAPAPVFVERGEFRGGTSRVRLTNDADVPMKLRGHFSPHGELEVSPAELEVLVSPNSVELVDVGLQPRRGKAKVDGLAPVTLSWQLTFQVEEGRPIELDGTAQVVVDRQLRCRAGESKRVDGDLAEWKDLPFVCRQPAQVRVAPDSWKGADDGSFRFGVEYDETHLYVAVEVTDELVVSDPEHLPWQQDGVELRVDARPDPDRSNGRGMGDNDAFLLVAASPGSTPAETVLYQPEVLARDGVGAVCVRRPGGYVLEMGVPRAYLDGKQGRAWSELRLNVSVDDVDEPNGALAQLCWRPDWRTPENYPASGTFVRR
ncbi:MAG: metallophosphoesterase [Candidatus Latescibacterota bacterium]